MAIRVDPPRVEARASGRTICRLSPRDEARWRALADRAAPLIEARLPDGVVADRAVRQRHGWRLAPMRPALRRARRAAASLAREGAVVATDVEAFFPSVTPETLERALLAVGAARGDAAAAASMLGGWAEQGRAGLPVGPAASSILANAVLLPVDLAVAPVRFLRWVDDYLLPAEYPLERFDEALAVVGLRRSERKTVRGIGGVWQAPYGR
ncbi:MAG TPA: RNA-directed DNA polymerase [Actinomycetota bacterium]